MSKSLAFLSLILFLSGCSKYSSKSADPKNAVEPEVVGTQTAKTQIGDVYDRVAGSQDTQNKYKKSIFKIENTVAGSPGVASYVGFYEGLYIFVTNKHVFDTDEVKCDELLSVSSLDGEDFFTCSEVAFSIDHMDVTFFGAQRWAGTRDLEKQVFKSSELLDKESFVLRTVDRDVNQIVVDQGRDCFALDSVPRLIKDPDVLSDLELSSWSIPIGCDSQPGDSGSPVFDKNGLIAGVLWGGKAVKSFKSSDGLLLESVSQNERIWLNYNFMVPANLIKTALKAGVDEKRPKTSAVIDQILEFSFE